MITITSAGGQAIKVANGKQSFVVFPEKEVKDAMALLSAPEETPSEATRSWPGEYDHGGVAYRGIGHDEGGKVSWVAEIDGVRCGFIPAPLHEWSDHELELMGDLDVLAVAAEDAKTVQKILDEVDPRVLIPLPTIDKDAFDEVLKVAGAKEKETVSEYKI